MSKRKIDYVVSSTTDDPIHVSSSSIANPFKKWKCLGEGTKPVYILLQLQKASVITCIEIGNEHSAYIEVLVSRFDDIDNFKVLLAKSSFMSASESRHSFNKNKVRMFTTNDFQTPEGNQKWNHIKIVCIQPFNRHVQYGISFVNVHITESQGDVVTSTILKMGKFSIHPDSLNNLNMESLFARMDLYNSTLSTEVTTICGASSLPGTSTTTSLQFKKHLESTKTKQKRLPWRRYSLESKPDSEDEIFEVENSRDIEMIHSRSNDEVVSYFKNKNHSNTENEVERIQAGNKSEGTFSCHTDEKIDEPIDVECSSSESPDFFSNKLLYIDKQLSSKDRRLLTQYIIAYNGKVVDDVSDTIDYIVSSDKNGSLLKDVYPKAYIVSSNWIWQCHHSKTFISPNYFKL